MNHRTLHPAGWPRPRGYANGIEANGRQIVVAGMIGWDAARQLVGTDLVSQARQTLLNIVAVLHEADARPEHLVRLTWYVTDREAYRAAAGPLGEVYREIIGRYFPAMTVVAVSGLMEPGALVEIEATAVVPPRTAERQTPRAKAR